jgi:hypothetical protein
LIALTDMVDNCHDVHVAAMPEYEDQKAKLNFLSQIDFFDETDFAQIHAEVENDAWIGPGDAMATLAILRDNGRGDQIYVPVNVMNPPVTRGATVSFPIENASQKIHGEVQISLIDVSGAEASGTNEWSIFYGPIRNPFDE